MLLRFKAISFLRGFEILLFLHTISPVDTEQTNYFALFAQQKNEILLSAIISLLSHMHFYRIAKIFNQTWNFMVVKDQIQTHKSPK